MILRLRLLRASFLVLALAGWARPALAQECVGLPGGRGMLSVGFEGTDGATGQGLSFAYRTPGAAVLLQHRSLEGFTLVDDLRTSEAQASVRLPAVRLPVCLTAGAQWTAYDNDRRESESWSRADPGHVTLRHRVGGPYRRLRVPVGVSLGREFRIGERLSLVPFVQPAVVFEREAYDPEVAPEQTRSDWGLGASGGVTAAYGWLVVRSTLTHTATHEYALSSQHNFPAFSLQAGVRF